MTSPGPRCSGILLHPTSLAGPYGIGDLGPEARRFAEFLAAAGQTVWQVLPLGPTGYGDSPYQCFSAHAGNPLLISLDDLAFEPWCRIEEITAGLPEFPADHVEFEIVIPWKQTALVRAAQQFLDRAEPRQRQIYAEFCARHAGWLDDFALFMALKQRFGMRAWTSWDPELRTRESVAIGMARRALAGVIENQRVLQFFFFRQWNGLRDYCRKLGIRIMGDLPIYVAHDSSDVWTNRELFQLDSDGNPTVVAGVPPDYFSSTGQLWGNPIYDWAALEADGYRWWIDRFQSVLQIVDIVRLDHFRGFVGYWEVPMPALTAEHGRWVEGPGAKLFRAAREALGDLPFVAENLGVITPEIEALRETFGFPGMSILQFAFGNDPQAPSFRPHNYLPNLVAYTGTHDCDTTVGWWTSEGHGESTRSAEEIRRERGFTLRYLDTDGAEIHWTFIRALLGSIARTALIPMQDVLGLGSEARMNQPATLGGNWRWRMSGDALSPQLAARLLDMVRMYDREGFALDIRSGYGRILEEPGRKLV